MTILIEQEMEAERKDSQSFLDAIADIEIDAPANYSATFEEQLYANKPSLANSPQNSARRQRRRSPNPAQKRHSRWHFLP